MAKIKLTAIQKKIACATLGAFIVLMIILAFMKFVPFEGKEEDETPNRPTDIGLRAAQLVEGDDIKGALELYDQQIESEKDNEDRKLLLIMKSREARGAGLSQESVSAAKQADEINSDDMTIRNLADAYRAAGDKEQALILYRKLLEENPHNEQISRRGPSLKDLIEELEQ